jgi:WD40 repeat protein
MATAEQSTGDDGVDPEAMEMVFKRDHYVDTTVHGKGISFVKWFGGALSNVAVYDEFASCLRLYDSDECKLVSQLGLPKPVGKDKPAKLTILCCLHIEEENLVVLSASDFVLYLWDMNKGILGRRKPKIISTLTAPTSQISLAWDDASKTLFSASVNQEILAWDVRKRKIKGTLRGHVDMIVDLVVISELDILASASLDDTVNLYGISELRLWGSCVGHKKGVRKIAWGHGLLYSCGFEFIVRCWLLDVDETGKRSAKGETIVTLEGAHEVMLLDVAVVPAVGARVLSCDVGGKFVVWDVGSNARFSGEGIVLQEFTAG